MPDAAGHDSYDIVTCRDLDSGEVGRRGRKGGGMEGEGERRGWKGGRRGGKEGGRRKRDLYSGEVGRRARKEGRGEERRGEEREEGRDSGEEEGRKEGGAEEGEGPALGRGTSPEIVLFVQAQEARALTQARCVRQEARASPEDSGEDSGEVRASCASCGP